MRTAAGIVALALLAVRLCRAVEDGAERAFVRVLGYGNM